MKEFLTIVMVVLGLTFYVAAEEKCTENGKCLVEDLEAKAAAKKDSKAVLPKIAATKYETVFDLTIADQPFQAGAVVSLKTATVDNDDNLFDVVKETGNIKAKTAGDYKIMVIPALDPPFSPALALNIKDSSGKVVSSTEIDDSVTTFADVQLQEGNSLEFIQLAPKAKLESDETIALQDFLLVIYKKVD